MLFIPIFFQKMKTRIYDRAIGQLNRAISLYFFSDWAIRGAIFSSFRAIRS